jgi:hypothetical protein
MVERVVNRKLYQVTISNAYKQAFVQGQKVSVGREHNPFFKLYETTIEYPITDGQTGGDHSGKRGGLVASR